MTSGNKNEVYMFVHMLQYLVIRFWAYEYITIYVTLIVEIWYP